MTEIAGPAEILRTRELIGWELVDREGEKIGSVADLLIDRQGRVSFLHVEWGLPRKHVLMPEHELEWGDGKFIVSRWTRSDVRLLPPYDPARPLSADLIEEMGRAYPRIYRRDPPEEEPGESRIVPLEDAKGFKVEGGAPDLRGWTVFGSDGERVGTVAGLLVDPASLKIRYIDVDLLDDLFLLGDDRHVLVPLEHVDLKERGNDAWVRRLTGAEVARFPAYTGGPVPPWMEREVGRAFE